MFKYAIFDLDDTLLDFKKGSRLEVVKILKKYGVEDLKYGVQVYEQVNHQVWHAIEQGADRNELLKTRFTKTFSKLGIKVDGIEVEANYRQRLRYSFHKIQGADQLLNDLNHQGVHLMVGTNGVKQTQLSRLHGSGLEDYFEDCFISEDIGYPKPDRRFFDEITHKYQDMNHTNTVMVGDSLTSDILGAKKAKLASVWYNPNQLPIQTEIKPTYVAGSLNQIKDIILK